ncbi:carbon starvation protein CstA [Anaerosporomusa subterranea]|uniref:Carbon starvation protein CstA n=1 Tax=Anaerosporomusa subterranea TaxID=1794912 RepID=A0A154BU10_ANASB|nr:carbon starvation CstA family protein [Anaerosporomusa subterranea]KYZ77466.1 carbon starvation protein CstA [Anaerosporomusa subterranea]
MNILSVVGLGTLILVIAYFTYGKFVSNRVFELDDSRVVAAVELEDGVDYEPTDAKYLAGQHFSAIAAAGPVTGPVIAGMTFGWVPTFLWIIIGTIFIGGLHDMGALVASIRSKASGIADTMKNYVSNRVWILFNVFIFFTLIMIIVAFTDITTASFVNTVIADDAVVGGGATATSSILYLILPVIMGFLLRYTKMSLGVATAIFLPLVAVSIWIGPYIPFNLQTIMGLETPQAAQKVWNVIIIVYCFIAGIVPVWALLQPRGHLGGYFLYATLVVAFIGILFGGFETKFPAWTNAFGGDNFWTPMFPMLFITVACGACSGFHSLVSSGTTSKQLKKESDAKPIGYGMMLAESVVALIALSCVMILPKGDALLGKSPNFIYANGLGSFMELIGISKAIGISFGLMAFTTFVYDTLDICTRLGRYIVQELTGWKGWSGRIISTLLIGGIPLVLMSITLTDPSGKPIAIWSLFWRTFGASNQLLAALALVGITVWLQRTAKNKKAWVATLIPAIFMFLMSSWALISTFTSYTFKKGVFTMPVGTNIVVPAMCLIYIVLAIWVVIECAPPIIRNAKNADPSIPPNLTFK